MKIPKLKKETINVFLSKILKKLSASSFFTFFIFFSLFLILGIIIFYQYAFLAKKVKIEASEEVFQFEEKAYEEILKVWEEKEERFRRVDYKEYPDPFQPISEEKELPEEKRLPEERIEELLNIPLIQDLLRAANLYDFYSKKGGELLLIEERAQIWQELGLGEASEYRGTYSQNIKFLEELKKELTE